MKLVKIAFKK
uniref:Uncharacterized protein n=1 Tax=Romanomermis culicivorax TaxID=13658 RepID=A0A915IRX4_ROMCU